MNRVETNLTWILLALIAIVTVGIFFLQNGFLLFKLKTYSQIFFCQVSGVALKRFFLFFIPAMLVVSFLKAHNNNVGFFSLCDGRFWHFDLCYRRGTRANIIIAFALFLFYWHRTWLDNLMDVNRCR